MPSLAAPEGRMKMDDSLFEGDGILAENAKGMSLFGGTGHAATETPLAARGLLPPSRGDFQRRRSSDIEGDVVAPSIKSHSVRAFDDRQWLRR
jgi:hypothetical protein